MATVSVAALTSAGTTYVQHATAKVTNTGHRRGTEIVQCYVSIRGASMEQPVRTLKGFTRVALEPGESKPVDFPLGFDELSFFSADKHRVVEPAEYTIFIGGSSIAEQSAQFRTTATRRSQ